MEYVFKGQCSDLEELYKLSSTSKIGDLYLIEGIQYIWNGEEWKEIQYKSSIKKCLMPVKCCGSCCFCDRKLNNNFNEIKTITESDINCFCLIHNEPVELFTTVCDEWR